MSTRITTQQSKSNLGKAPKRMRRSCAPYSDVLSMESGTRLTFHNESLERPNCAYFVTLGVTVLFVTCE